MFLEFSAAARNVKIPKKWWWSGLVCRVLKRRLWQLQMSFCLSYMKHIAQLHYTSPKQTQSHQHTAHLSRLIFFSFPVLSFKKKKEAFGLLPISAAINMCNGDVSQRQKKTHPGV